MDTDGLSAVEELEARKEILEDFALHKDLTSQTAVCNWGQEVWRLGNETMRQVLTLYVNFTASLLQSISALLFAESSLCSCGDPKEKYFTQSHGESIRASPKAS